MPGMRLHLLSSCVLVTAASAFAQSNAVPGTDVNLYEMGSASYYGREGDPYPNGTIGFAFGHSMCNAGSVHIPWDFIVGNQMQSTHPKIAFLVVKEVDGRMYQVSNRAFLKHSRFAFNFSSGACAPCQSGPPDTFRIGCADTYGPGFNASQSSLGPTGEIDPWLGTFDSVGSYFDRGDPSVGGAAATDNVYTLSPIGFGAVKNRVNCEESDLTGAGTFRAQCHVVILGEPLQNRANNLRSKAIDFNWGGSSWTVSTSGGSVQGPVLTQWTGATTDIGGNGTDDGRFMVGVNVTGPVDGKWHYEYAVQNIDNSRGAATFRIPIAPGAIVDNVGVHDIDQDDSNDWSHQFSGDELTFSAGVDNALEWNTIYNFWFDCSAAPVFGQTTLDQALPGPGQSDVTVGARVPQGVLNAATAVLGDSDCGGAGMTLAASARPVLGTSITLDTTSIPGGTTAGALILSFDRSNPAIDLTPIGMANCAYHGAGSDAHLPFSLPIGSAAQFPVSFPNVAGLVGVQIVGQSFTVGPLLTSLGVVGSNGLLLGLATN